MITFAPHGYEGTDPAYEFGLPRAEFEKRGFSCMIVRSPHTNSKAPPMTMNRVAARTYSGATPRAQLIRAAFQLEWLTVAWMVVEAAIALASGLMARSVSLIAFGVDSLIELASAGVLIWRLTVELRRGESFARAAERRASRIGGALLLALAAYVVVAAGWSLWTRQGAEFSWPGLLVSLAAIPVMWLLSRRKLRIAEALGSLALRADAVESITCGWLSFVVLIGLLAQMALGAWWVDAVTSLVVVWLLVKEGREAWQGEEADD